MGSENSHLVGVIDGQMCIYKNEDIGNGFGEREVWREERPGMGICVEDYYEEGGRWAYGLLISRGVGGSEEVTFRFAFMAICTIYTVHCRSG